MARRLALFAVLLLAAFAPAQERIKDVIYWKNGGTAFTLDVFKPKEASGAAVIYLVSGGWFSSHDNFNGQLAEALNAQGFTVFQVVHGSQPRYKIPEISGQITRAVRFIRANAATFGIDANRMGITGASAGGHLSLMTAGRPNAGDPNAKDPVDRVSNEVAAVVAIYPPTDFMNYGGAAPGTIVNSPMFAPFKAAFGLPPSPTIDQIETIAKDVSPIQNVNPKFPPTLFIHGDKDILVPIQQSQVMFEALKKAGVATELLTVEGGGHDGNTFIKGLARMMSWFKEKLAKKG